MLTLLSNEIIGDNDEYEKICLDYSPHQIHILHLCPLVVPGCPRHDLICDSSQPHVWDIIFKSSVVYKKWLVTKHSNLIYHNMQNWTNAFTLKFYCLWFPLRKASLGKYLGMIGKGRGWLQPSSSVYYPPAQQSESLSHKWLKENSYWEGIIKKNCS